MWDIGTLHVTSLQLALVLIPKSIPTELSAFGKVSSYIYTTKLKKYLLAESLIIVTKEGWFGNGIDQTTFKFPILAK